MAPVNFDQHRKSTKQCLLERPGHTAALLWQQNRGTFTLGKRAALL
jgi:hypothetical protein